jgi:hypothetical protein
VGGDGGKEEGRKKERVRVEDSVREQQGDSVRLEEEEGACLSSEQQEASSAGRGRRRRRRKHVRGSVTCDMSARWQEATTITRGSPTKKT